MPMRDWRRHAFHIGLKGRPIAVLKDAIQRPGQRANAIRSEKSDREAFVGGRMEQLLRRKQPRGETLGVVVTQECLQDIPIGSKPVGPEIIPHEFARGSQLLVDKGQRDLGSLKCPRAQQGTLPSTAQTP